GDGDGVRRIDERHGQVGDAGDRRGDGGCVVARVRVGLGGGDGSGVGERPGRRGLAGERHGGAPAGGERAERTGKHLGADAAATLAGGGAGQAEARRQRVRHLDVAGGAGAGVGDGDRVGEGGERRRRVGRGGKRQLQVGALRGGGGDLEGAA